MAPVPFVRAERQCWLLKSEPEVYGIGQLKKDRTAVWEGVRNYQARNFMRDHMRVGDPVLFYHSGAEVTGVVGLAKVSRVGVADPTQFESKSEYCDPKSKPDAPTWICVEIEFVAEFQAPVTLATIKATRALDGMLVTQRGQRLSVQPVAPAHYDWIAKAGGKK